MLVRSLVSVDQTLHYNGEGLLHVGLDQLSDGFVMQEDQRSLGCLKVHLLSCGHQLVEQFEAKLIKLFLGILAA